MLKSVFNENAVHLTKVDHDYSMRGDIENSIGRIATNSFQEHSGKVSLENKEKKRQHLDHILTLLEDARRALIADIAQMQRDLDKLIEDRDNVIDKKNAISDVLDELRENGKIEVGEDCYPADEKARAAIKEFEQKTGKKFDANSPEVAEMLHYIILDLEQQETALDQKINDKVHEIEEANELLDDLSKGVDTEGKVNQKAIENAQSFIAKKEELTSKLEKVETSEALDSINEENQFVDVSADFKF